MKKYLFLLISLLISINFENIKGQELNPKANFKSIVSVDNVRFTVLTPQLIRMEWSEDKKFEDHASFVFINRDLTMPKYSVESEEEWLILKTQKIILRYRKGTGKFSSNNLSISFELNGKEIIWYPGMYDSLNLKGTIRTLDFADGDSIGSAENINMKPIQLEQGVVSRSGWSLIDDSQRFLFDGSDWNWVMKRTSDERQDWYFFGYGHNYKQALYDFTKVAGKIPMPPKFAFGYWWSRYWIYSDNELKNLVKEIKDYEIPIDVLIIDMDWHYTYGFRSKDIKLDPVGEWLGWTGYTWNKELFPEPEQFLKWTKKQNLKIALNLHPASGIPSMEEKYPQFAKAFGFDTTGHKYIPFQMTNKKWAETYFDVLLKPLEKQGVDFWWLDWQQFKESKYIKGLSNTWWLNYTFFTSMERRGEKRPLLFHRWGGLGNHRYQIGFSGDVTTNWKSLAFQPYFTATASNVGYGYWSHDIGGHNPGGIKTDPELYLRWIQFGIFGPIFRTHCSKQAVIERRFWKFPDHFNMMRNAVQLRYSLVPYIYTASRECFDSGISICRPMYYDYPEKQEAYDFKSQYMFGDNILVAPIDDAISENNLLAKKKLWLPDGDWYEWFSGTIIRGGSVIERTFSTSEIPIYVKAGSIIPMYTKINNLQNTIDTLVLTIIPNGISRTKIYEDDGKSDDYKKNKFAFSEVRTEQVYPDILKVTIFPVEGQYENMPKERAYEIRLPRSFPPKEIRINGEQYFYSYDASEGKWTYRGTELSTHIFIPKLSCEQKTEIIIKYSKEYEGKDNSLNGKIGRFRRMSTIVNMLKYEIARTDWGATLPNLILGSEQTPTKIDYNPQNILLELQKFDDNYEAMIAQILKIPGADIIVLKKCVDHLK